MIDGLMITNIMIFSAKIVVELSIQVNRMTNIFEGVNLAILLFAMFMSFTL